MTFTVGTNVVASQPPERRPTGTLHTRAKKINKLREGVKNIHRAEKEDEPKIKDEDFFVAFVITYSCGRAIFVSKG